MSSANRTCLALGGAVCGRTSFGCGAGLTGGDFTGPSLFGGTGFTTGILTGAGGGGGFGGEATVAGAGGGTGFTLAAGVGSGGMAGLSVFGAPPGVGPHGTHLSADELLLASADGPESTGGQLPPFLSTVFGTSAAFTSLFLGGLAAKASASLLSK